mgnify:CR=1 FL=1
MWTDITRRRYARADLLLPSDLTDAEWEILEPLLPVRGKLGRPPVWDYRQIVEAILYLLRGGLPWRMLPPGLFPPMTTVQHYFYRWSAMGVWKSINHAATDGPRGGGPGSLAQRGRDRQPERENDGKWRPTGL